MKIIKSFIGTNYRLFRGTAGLVESKVLKRLPEDSIVRLSASSTLGLLDAIVGRITGDESLKERGGAMADTVSKTLHHEEVVHKPMDLARAMTPPPWTFRSSNLTP